MVDRGVIAKVVNGQIVKHLSFRFFVTVFVTFGDKTHLCGGVIYDPSHVLTAGHCLSGGVDRVVVRAFDNQNIFDKFTHDDYDALAHATHPLYDDDLLHNDYGIIRLKRNFTFGYDQVVFASSNKLWRENGADDAFTAVGHGLTESGGASEKLRAAKLARVASEKCPYHAVVLGYDYCAESFVECADGECADTCQGDSGGPLFQTEENAAGKTYASQIPSGGVIVFGLTSRGGTCGSNKTPGIYSPVHLALDWLQRFAETKIARPTVAVDAQKKEDKEYNTALNYFLAVCFAILVCVSLVRLLL